ncbi:MAG: divalent-cation tolerance protein CutA [Pirellulaceae bacterium]|jgi:periplasmic divalent cation tolerance protein|nr:divalent-cation tolerance protein CutA [Pirellulaceae bacterium]MDP7020716.1 divalent-cation tolerance protein CutA [Pirellulaceae bacterium]
MDVIQVTTAVSSQDDARRIAGAMVERGLAACAQVSGPVDSVYRWQGQIEAAAEWVCTLKTTARNYDQVEQLILELHPYEVPQVIATPVIGGSSTYLQWLADNLIDAADEADSTTSDDAEA